MFEEDEKVKTLRSIEVGISILVVINILDFLFKW
jgi:hypothetical protein